MLNFKWDDTRYFLAIARSGTPSRAAEQLGTDRSTVGRRIAAIEEALKTKLLVRRDQMYVLTDQGEKLLQAAEATESLMLSLENSIRGNELSGVVRVGAADGLGSYFLAPRIAKFLQSEPQLQIDLLVMSRQFDMSKREADITLTMSRSELGNQLARKLTDVKLVAYASVEYLARYPVIKQVSDFETHVFISYNDITACAVAGVGKYSRLQRSLPGSESMVHRRLVSNNIVAQFQATVAGGGICFLPRYMVQGTTNLRAILPEKVQISLEMWLAIHRDLRRVVRVRAVADFIASQVSLCKELFS